MHNHECLEIKELLPQILTTGDMDVQYIVYYPRLDKRQISQVSEFSLADGQSSTSTSLLRSLCHSDDSVILGTRFQDTEEAAIEDQLLANSASGSGAIEHDPCSLFRPTKKGIPKIPKCYYVSYPRTDRVVKFLPSSSRCR